MGKLQHQEPLGDGLDPGTDQGQTLASDISAKIADGESGAELCRYIATALTWLALFSSGKTRMAQERYRHCLRPGTLELSRLHPNGAVEQKRSDPFAWNAYDDANDRVYQPQKQSRSNLLRNACRNDTNNRRTDCAGSVMAKRFF